MVRVNLFFEPIHRKLMTVAVRLLTTVNIACLLVERRGSRCGPCKPIHGKLMTVAVTNDSHHGLPSSGK